MKRPLAIFWAICMGLLATAAIPERALAESDVEELLARIEARYTAKAFSAGFVQVTTDKAMGISDDAEGTLQVKYPGKMRWVYDYPERHFFITDGATVWMYKPDDHQVVRGTATEILGDSKGATFLSDVGLIRERFSVSRVPGAAGEPDRLKLVPREEKIDIAVIYLAVSGATGDIVEVTTVDAYENETRIVFKDVQFKADLPDDLFTFQVPEGTDVLEYSP